MDSSADWTAYALFSPSKARAQQAQAKDWAFVDAWLAKKYDKRIPVFERSEETLQALLSLATLNEAADEQRGAVERVEKLAMQAHSRRGQESNDAFQSIIASLTNSGLESLQALSDVAITLETADHRRMAMRLATITTDCFDLAEQLRSSREQQHVLQQEDTRLKGILHALHDDSLKAPSSLSEQTVELGRNSKQMRAKLNEYDERLRTLGTDSSISPSMDNILEQLSLLKAERERMHVLKTELDVFEGLPSDPKAARSKLESARRELETITSRRDTLFERLLDTK
ncbi:hypothetical protein M433DRAFT_151403 [Acidomyces richmondensis BFW]|nr:MAG: hypothetical protein FE78DRAFT_85304 [Acidomyces sp. 'richmondensis']KYG48188.1 hypothetical protein M433DRAFT_151403 [Acidomyces richmondensis BFW]